MKKTNLLKSMLLLCALIVGSMNSWAADPVTITWSISGVSSPSAKDQPCNTTLSTSTISGGSGIWTASTGSNNCYSATDAGTAHFGSSKTKFNGTITLSDSSIPSSATITGISLDGTSNGSYTVAATVGENSFGSSQSFTSGSGCSFSGSVVGNEIVLTFSTTSNSNVCISEITVTYTAEIVHVEGVSLPSTANVAVGKTITLTPTIMPITATNKNVSWESKNTSIATVSDAGVVTGVAEGTVDIEVTTADGTYKATCKVTVDDGAIDLANTGTITFNTFNGDVLGTGGYKEQNCELQASNASTYTWAEKDGYYNNGGWQIKNSTGKVTSPVIKSANGFTVTVTTKTNNVRISDGTNSGTNTLTTTKTNTTITIQGDGAYAVFTGITIVPTPTNPSNPVDNLDGTITLTTTSNMAGWRTFYNATQDYEVDANTTIYVAKKSATEDVVELTAVVATKIPQGEAVILKTTDAGHSMTLTETTGAESLGANVLEVTDGTNNVNGYRLGYGKIGGSDAVGFFKYVTTTAPAAGIVYIDESNVNVSAGAHGLAINFDEGDVTAIKTVNADQQFVAPRKVMKDGCIVIESAKGTFTLSGARIK